MQLLLILDDPKSECICGHSCIHPISSIPSNGCGGVAGSLIVARGVAKVPTTLTTSDDRSGWRRTINIGCPYIILRCHLDIPMGWYRFTKSKRSSQCCHHFPPTWKPRARACNHFLMLHGKIHLKLFTKLACMSVHIIC